MINFFKSIDIDILEKAFCFFGLIFIILFVIFGFSSLIDFTDEKECVDYYRDYGYKLKTCERWFD